MSRYQQIPWPLFTAAAVTVLLWLCAPRLSDWGQDAAYRLILRPLAEMLRLAW